MNTKTPHADQLVRRWRFLVGLGLDRSTAWDRAHHWPEHFDGEFFRDCHRQDHRPDRPPHSHAVVAVDLTASEDAELVATLEALGKLSASERAAFLAHQLRLDAFAEIKSTDLASAELAMIAVLPGRPVDQILTPLLELEPPSTTTSPKFSRLVLGACAVTVVALLVLTTSRREPAPQTAAFVSSTSTAPRVELALTTTESTREPIVSFVAPDRELDISVSDSGQILRRDPDSGVIIWSSRPFDNPVILSIDPNSISVRSRGTNLIVSMTDGTLLPP